MNEKPQHNLRNHEVVTLAVYLLGGDSKAIDTEDVAIKANELAPGRFTWTKYPDQINIEIIRAFLSDAKKPKHGTLMTGTGTTGWLLTEAGLKFAVENKNKVASPAKAVTRLSKDETRRRKNELARVMTSVAYEKYAAGKSKSVTPQEADSVFRLNEYIVGDARQKKVLRVVNVLGEDEEVGSAIRFFAEIAQKRG